MASSKRFSSTNVRSFAIMGHVDHGKTAYTDSLLAANNIISSRMAGKIRYLDSREDEQERGITMESSAVSLSFKLLRPGEDEQPRAEDFMINLIDTPGHVDFSSEVSTASRLCDGALIMVDVVEGVCTQTIAVLHQAYAERLRPILVINKMDRLITELKLAPVEAYHHLSNLIENVNAVMGSFYASDRMEDNLRWREAREVRLAARREAEASASPPVDEDETAYEERDDEDLYFSPEKGNVLFASALDGWAFRVGRFAQLYAAKLGIKETNLRRVLWGDFYLDPKTKRIIGQKALGKRPLKPLFVQFVLENVWAVYENVVMNPNPDKITKIVSALNLKLLPRDLKSKDPRTLLSSIFSSWLPLASATFSAVVDQIPPPSSAQRLRLPKMLHPTIHPPPTEPSTNTERALYACAAGADQPVVAYVSKMFAVPVADLPQNRRKELTAEDMRERGRASRERVAALSAALQATGMSAADDEAAGIKSVPIDQAAPAASPAREEEPATPATEEEQPADRPSGPVEALIGFARLYSGTLRVGQEVRVLQPKYNTALRATDGPNAKHVASVTVQHLYMMMGRDLVAVNEVPAGNVFAIGGLEGTVLRNATIVAPGEGGEEQRENWEKSGMVNLAGVAMQTAPIVRVALEPRNPADMSKLVEGLRLLNQADSCVEVLVQETGEHVILTAGELHLERCLKDLRERFAKCDIQASKPIVPFRETAVRTPDMAPTKTKDAPRGTIHGTSSGGAVSFTVRAVPLAQAITDLLLQSRETLQQMHAMVDRRRLEDPPTLEATGISIEARALAPEAFWAKLEELLGKAGPDWRGLADSIWAFGPKRTGANLLVDRRPGSTHSLRKRVANSASLHASRAVSGLATPAAGGAAEPLPDDIAVAVESKEAELATHVVPSHAFEESIETGYQIATWQGPLCAEPVVGMAYFVEKIEAAEGEIDHSKVPQITGSLISASRDAFRQGLLDWSPRLLMAMYSCDIQASTDVLGKVYAVVSRRRGRIVAEEMKEGTAFFTVRSLLPVVESFGFADEIRKRTSGAASPQLIFSGYELFDQDPFWVPTTEEELEDLGEKAERENVARRYMDGVRARKGMFVEKKIVENAEKQRTLKR